MAAILKLAHVMLGFCFVTGLLARNLIMVRAARQTDVQIVGRFV